jgi:hypothetical protein
MKSQQAAEEVAAYLRARTPLLWIVTREEARVERYLIEACEAAKYRPLFWDCGDGVTDLNGNKVPKQSPYYRRRRHRLYADGDPEAIGRRQ